MESLKLDDQKIVNVTKKRVSPESSDVRLEKKQKTKDSERISVNISKRVNWKETSSMAEQPYSLKMDMKKKLTDNSLEREATIFD